MACWQDGLLAYEFFDSLCRKPVTPADSPRECIFSSVEMVLRQTQPPRGLIDRQQFIVIGSGRGLRRLDHPQLRNAANFFEQTQKPGQLRHRQSLGGVQHRIGVTRLHRLPLARIEDA